MLARSREDLRCGTGKECLEREPATGVPEVARDEARAISGSATAEVQVEEARELIDHLGMLPVSVRTLPPAA